ncbi:MAG TPA: SRPBCC family protein [Actinomycetota bacterium]|nr:SRPBCC family protein [Actinomycetota bacterium]
MVAATSSGKATLTLPADDQILITREFAAPRDRVYRACTDPELVRQWWAADMGTVTSAEIDLRVGGKWRYVMVTNEGFEVAFHGEYKEIVPNERIVSTEAYEGVPDPDANATVNTVTYEETDGGTAMTVLVQCPSKEVRDAIIESGMESGMQRSYDYLERVAQSLA